MGNRNSSSTGTGTFPRLIHCEHCGEDYASTYRACPFCNTTPGGKKTAPARQRSDAPVRRSSGRVSGNSVPTNTRGGGYGGAKSPLSMIGIVISVLLVIAAIVIVIFLVCSVFSGTPEGSSGTSGTSQTGSDDAQTSEGAAQYVTLDQQDFTLASGQSVTLVPTVSPTDWAGQLIWTSSDDAVATVDQTGLVTYVGGGTCTISVSAGGTAAECTVRCQSADAGDDGTTVPDDTSTPDTTEPGDTTPPEDTTAPQDTAQPAAGDPVVVRYLSSERTDISLSTGESVPLNAVGGDGSNYTWSMADSSVATISAEGQLTGVSAGKTTLTVTSGGQSAEVIIRVS